MNHETDLRNGNYEESGRDSWMACGEILVYLMEEFQESCCVADENFCHIYPATGISNK